MPVARTGASSAGNGSSRLLLAVALAAVSATLAFASSAAPAQAACGFRVSLPPDRASSLRATTSLSQPASFVVPSTARASRVFTARSVAEWLGGRAATALAEKTFLTGIEWVARMAGHRNTGERTLQQLGEIRGHLDQISGRLGRVEDRLEALISEERNGRLDAALRPLCEIADSQESLFTNYYEPLMKAGYRLAAILEKTPKLADRDDGSGISPRERVQFLLPRYLEEARVADRGNPARTLHRALVPNGHGTSVLSDYGLVLMTQRFLSTTDSKRLRNFHSGLADVRAVATWMSEEYWSRKPGFRDAVRARQKKIIKNNAVENRNLPRMIPPGVVVDLGDGGANRIAGRPMWYPPVAQDVGWLPPIQVGARFGSTISNSQVDRELATLNNLPRAVNNKPNLGSGWAAPTNQQVTALLSDRCVVDAADPTRFRNGVHCINAVGPNSGGNVAGYLQRANRGSAKWRQLFCQEGPCPQGAGPGGPTSPRHAFIWTRNIHTEMMFCGRNRSERRPPEFRRAVPAYSGFSTTAARPFVTAFPTLLGRTPPGVGRGVVDEATAFNRCDSWIAKMIREAPARKVWTSGILLATRYGGKQDLNPLNRIDFMAQR